MEFFSPIESYMVSYIGGGESADNDYRAMITLKNEGRPVGFLYFHRDPASMPIGDALTGRDTPHPQAHLHFLAEDLPRVVDLLRNEAPVSLVYYYGPEWDAGIGSLETAYEAVGDGEMPAWSSPAPRA